MKSHQEQLNDIEEQLEQAYLENDVFFNPTTQCEQHY